MLRPAFLTLDNNVFIAVFWDVHELLENMNAAILVVLISLLDKLKLSLKILSNRNTISSIQI